MVLLTHLSDSFFSAPERSFFLTFFAFTGGSCMADTLWSSDAFSPSSARFLFLFSFKKKW